MNTITAGLLSRFLAAPEKHGRDFIALANSIANEGISENLAQNVDPILASVIEKAVEEKEPRNPELLAAAIRVDTYTKSSNRLPEILKIANAIDAQHYAGTERADGLVFPKLAEALTISIAHQALTHSKVPQSVRNDIAKFLSRFPKKALSGELSEIRPEFGRALNGLVQLRGEE